MELSNLSEIVSIYSLMNTLYTESVILLENFGLILFLGQFQPPF